MGNFSFSTERDGISVILGAGPSYGMAGSGHINMDAKMGNELYKKDFYIKEIENDENIDQ